jgi:phenol 2-monooxygenase (NADPH)
MLPQIIIRAADARPFELQDLLPADTRFKVLIFAGDAVDEAQCLKVKRLAEWMSSSASFLMKYGSDETQNKAFDIIVVTSGKVKDVNYTDIPEFFRSHWSKCVYRAPS